MAKRVWVGIPQVMQPVSDVTSRDGEEIGVEYDVDTFAIETSGALTLWREVVEGHRSELIVAYAPGTWTKCHVLGPNGEPVATLSER